jgi:hypothetical protein
VVNGKRGEEAYLGDNMMRHVTIYREEGRYGGWPANYGIWSWGDEIVVGFTLGYYKADSGFHARDRDRPFVPMQARSLDGGLTWQLRGTPCRTPGNRGLSADEHMHPDLGAQQALNSGMQNAPVDCPGSIDFTHADFALMCGRSGLRAGATSWFYVSTDRCQSWQGPYGLPMFGQTGIAARTDYLVSDAHTCTLFLTAAKPNGDEGRVFCARTADGGKTFAFLSCIGPEPEGYTIMPASVRLSGSRILAALRCHEGERNWIDLYASDDDGATWDYANTPAANTGRGGNPPAMIKLQDGWLCLTYGYRDALYGIRARLSSDDGATWDEEIILRDGGGNHDLGYTRTVQRMDGRLVTVYYWNDHPEGERYIAATVWRP